MVVVVKVNPQMKARIPPFKSTLVLQDFASSQKKHKKQNEAYASVLDSFLSEAADNSVLGKQKENC